jgi:hypothetical protein
VNVAAFPDLPPHLPAQRPVPLPRVAAELCLDKLNQLPAIVLRRCGEAADQQRLVERLDRLL